LRRTDRLFWIWLCRHWSRWRTALVVVQPETVLRWHREGFRRHWRCIREATPFGTIPRFLIHDNDGIFGQLGRCIFPRPRTPGRSYRCTLDGWLDGVLGIQGLPIPYGAPNANPHIERFWRTLREECLRRFVFLSEGHLRRTVRSYVSYYNGGRVHQGIEGIPEPEPGALAPPDGVVDVTQVPLHATRAC
jgi:hypothetical protein